MRTDAHGAAGQACGSPGRVAWPATASSRAASTAPRGRPFILWNSRNSRVPAGAADVVDGHGALCRGQTGVRSPRPSDPSVVLASTVTAARVAAVAATAPTVPKIQGRLLIGRGSWVRDWMSQGGSRLDVGDGVLEERREVGRRRLRVSHRVSSSRMRRAAAPREAWLLTAPRLMPSVLGDRGLVEVEVVAQRQHLALRLGQLLQGVEHRGRRSCASAPASAAAAAPGAGGGAGPGRRGAAAPTGSG